jgi:mannose-6-phosphate isomerase-like protein (cupin superfamily)
LLEKIYVNDEYVALLIQQIDTDNRIEFFTDPDDLLQIAAFSMSANQSIQPHLHLDQQRLIQGTNEILFVQSGELIVDFYKNKDQEIIDKSFSLYSGDLIYLKSGIHGFRIGVDCKFIEIKQGPFVDGEDKLKLY